MRVYLKVFLVAAIALNINGCFDFDLGFYSSGVPLSSSKRSRIDSNLLGNWRQIEMQDQEEPPIDIRFIKFNQREYVLISPDTNDDGWSIMRAYIVNLKGVLFLNLQSLEEDERVFLFCRYSISVDKVLTLKLVGKKLFKKEYKSSKKLNKFIKKNLKNSELYNMELKFKFQAE